MLLLMHYLDWIKFKLPIKVHVDNIGAIYLAKKATTNNKTKHVDTRYHFVREYIEKGEVVIKFMRSGENDSDIMTKNMSPSFFFF